MIKTLRAALLAAALAVGATAHAQVLEIGFDASPTGLDPHLVTAFASVQINSGIYEGLTGIDKDLRVVPLLASSWTVSQDGKTYTFTLRSGVTFHDGSAFGPEDVVASIRRVLNQQIASPLASRVNMIENIAADGADKVVMRLNAASPQLLASLATIAIVPRSMETNRDALQRQPVGTGPFRFQQWVPDTYIQLQRHQGYWQQGAPRIDGLKFNIVPEAATRMVGLQGGTYAMLPNVDAATALQLQGRPNVRIMETQDLAYTLIGLNTSERPFNDPRVREAVNYALNRAQLVQAAYNGRAAPGQVLSPALTDWALPASRFACYQHNPARARELLAAAGHANGLEITLKVLGSISQVRDVAQVVQAQMNQAGFRVNLEVQEQGRFIQDWRNSNFQGFVSINGGFPDPDDTLYRTVRTGGSTNVFKYSDARVDELLDRGRSVSDQAQRREIYNQVQDALACQGPVVFLAYAQLFTALRTNVQGYEMLATRSLWYLRNVAVAR